MDDTPRRNIVKHRTCIKCQTKFMSSGPGHRLCGLCAGGNKHLEGRPSQTAHTARRAGRNLQE